MASNGRRQPAEVECLACGARRSVARAEPSAGECPSCGYLGWAEPRALRKHELRALGHSVAHRDARV